MYYQETCSRVDKLHKHNRWKSEAEVRESVDFKQGELKGTDEGTIYVTFGRERRIE